MKEEVEGNKKRGERRMWTRRYRGEEQEEEEQKKKMKM